MTVPNQFASRTTAIPLSELDTNFNTPITIGNTAVQLGNTVTTLNNMTLANVTISSVASAITVAEGGTGLANIALNNVVLGNNTNSVQVVAPGTSGNVLTSDGTTWKSSAPAASGVTSFNAGSTGFTPNSATTGAVTLAGTLAEANGGTGTTTGYYGFKNRIINGAMMIDQRNAGASKTNPADFMYSVDRWCTYSSQASKFTIQQNAGSVTPPTGFTNYVGVTSSSAYTVGSGEIFELYQVIEGFNTADLGWGAAGASTVTLSFLVCSSLTGTFGGGLTNSGNTRNYPFTYTINAANTWEQKTITIAGDTTGTWLKTNGFGINVVFNLGAGSSFLGTANAWNGTTSAFFPTGTTNLVSNNGATLYITGVQLEKGSTATSFDYRPYGTELALCQRYLPYFGGVSSINQSFGMCYANNTTALRSIINFPVQARTQPTGLVASTASGFVGQMIGSSNLTASAVSLVSINSSTNAMVEYTVSGATSGNVGTIYNASSGYIYFTGCEL